MCVCAQVDPETSRILAVRKYESPGEKPASSGNHPMVPLQALMADLEGRFKSKEQL